MQNFGIDVEQMQKAVIEMSLYKGVFKEGDKAYLDGVTPEGETVNGEKANYKLFPPRNQNKCIQLRFRRIDTK